MKLKLCMKILLTILYVSFGLMGITLTFKSSEPVFIFDVVACLMLGMFVGVGIYELWFVNK